MHRLPLQVRGRKIQFLEATASSFTKQRLIGLGVNLNILVLSVIVYTLALNVIFVDNLGEIFPDQPVLPSQVMHPTPINLNRLEPYLNGYFLDIISAHVSGFTIGFALHFSGVVNTQQGKNLPSALANPTVVDQKLAKELSALSGLAGHFTAAPFHPFRVSLLDLFPTKRFGEFRLIHMQFVLPARFFCQRWHSYRKYLRTLCHSYRCYSLNQTGGGGRRFRDLRSTDFNRLVFGV